MTAKVEDAVIRELSTNELDVVSGAAPVQSFREPVSVGVMGWRFQFNPNNGVVVWRGVDIGGQRGIIFDSNA